jgi:hypothetical protein
MGYDDRAIVGFRKNSKLTFHVAPIIASAKEIFQVTFEPA